MKKRGPNTPEGRARSLANLKPVGPNNNLNPKGRPPAAGASVREWWNTMQEWSEEEVKKVLTGTGQPINKRVAAREWLQALDGKSPNVAGSSVDRIFDRTLGKPAQAIELTGKDGEAIEVNHNVDLRKLSTDELRQYRELRLKMESAN